MTVFTFRDYKAFLQAKLREASEHRGFQTKLAKAAQCQPSFLTKVLKTASHLTPEQALGIAHFLGLDDLSQDYFIAIVDWARAGSPALKKFIEKKMRRYKNQFENLASRTKAPLPLPEQQALYFYSHWLVGAIHMALTIPELQSIDALSRRFRVSPKEVQSIIHSLKDLGLAEERSLKWVALSPTFHLPKENPLNAINHQHWRMRSIEDIQRRTQNSLHYSSLCSLSQVDFEKIKTLLLELIDHSRAVVSPSPEQTLACLCLDWFEL